MGAEIKGFKGSFTHAIMEEANDDELLKNTDRDKQNALNLNATIDWFAPSPSKKKKT